VSRTTDAVNGVAFGPDGRIVASASDDKTLRLWDVRTHNSSEPPQRPRRLGLRGGVQPRRARILASASTERQRLDEDTWMTDDAERPPIVGAAYTSIVQ
jgi:WD40 repeat protein